MAQAQAAFAIAAMTKGVDAQSAENQASVAREGGIVPLVELLSNAGAEGRSAAAGARRLPLSGYVESFRKPFFRLYRSRFW